MNIACWSTTAASQVKMKVMHPKEMYPLCWCQSPLLGVILVISGNFATAMCSHYENITSPGVGYA